MGRLIFLVEQLPRFQQKIDIVPEEIDLVIGKGVREAFQGEEVFRRQSQQFRRVLRRSYYLSRPTITLNWSHL